MSYILEALADSEHARRRFATTPRYSLLPVMGEDQPRQRRWPYMLAGALLLNAALLQVWLRPAAPGNAAPIEMPAPAPLAVAASAPAPEIALPARSETAATLAAVVQPSEKPPPTKLEPSIAGQLRPPAGVVPTPRAAPANLPRERPPVVVAKPLAQRAPEAAAAAVAPALPPSSSPLPSAAMAGLPPALQKELAALSVAGFIHDEGTSSMVIVNDRLLREGDEVAPGLLLEKISAEGLILNYNGRQFRR